MKTELFTDYIDLAVEGVAPVVVELRHITIEEKIAMFADIADAGGVLAAAVSAVRKRTYQGDKFPTTI